MDTSTLGNRPVLMGESHKVIPGFNADRINVAAGLGELAKFWPDASAETKYVIEYALMRWARGEEAAAERGAIDRDFYGVDLTSWRRVLAAAMAAGAQVRE